MGKKNEVLHSLTTRLPPRDFLAVQLCAAEKNMTESAYVRWLVSNSVDVQQMPVPEDYLIRLKSATVRHRKIKPRRSWLSRIFR